MLFLFLCKFLPYIFTADYFKSFKKPRFQPNLFKDLQGRHVNLKKKKTKKNLIPNQGGWKVKVDHWCLTLCDPFDYTVHGILQTRILEWVAFPFSRGSSQHRDQTQFSHTPDSFPAEPQVKPKNTRVGRLYLQQWIFLTQELNWGLSCIAHGVFTNWAIREALGPEVSRNFNSCWLLSWRRVWEDFWTGLKTAETYPGQFSTFVKSSE